MKNILKSVSFSTTPTGRKALPDSEVKPNNPCRFELVLVFVVTAFRLGIGQDQH